MDKVLAKIISDTAEENGLSKEECEQMYDDLFLFIKETIASKDLSNAQTNDDLREIKVNFNVPRILKYYTTITRINYARRKTK